MGVKKAEIVKADERDEGKLALQLKSLMSQQAAQLNGIHEFMLDTREVIEKQGSQLANLSGKVTSLNSTILQFKEDQLGFRLAVEEVQTLVRDALLLERQRLAKERDLDHQEKLGRIVNGSPRAPDLQAKVDNSRLDQIWTRLEQLSKALKVAGLGPGEDPVITSDPEVIARAKGEAKERHDNAFGDVTRVLDETNR